MKSKRLTPARVTERVWLRNKRRFDPVYRLDDLEKYASQDRPLDSVIDVRRLRFVAMLMPTTD